MRGSRRKKPLLQKYDRLRGYGIPQGWRQHGIGFEADSIDAGSNRNAALIDAGPDHVIGARIGMSFDSSEDLLTEDIENGKVDGA